MTLTGGIVIFFLAWWMVFFAVLPIGVRGQFEDNDVVEGSEPGAPVRPMMRKKLLWSTIGALAITIFAWGILASDLMARPVVEW